MNFTYTAMDADIPVIYMGVNVHILVKCVIRYSENRTV
jgi:hypothetical protein